MNFQEINNILPLQIRSLLSDKGVTTVFPSQGILAQAKAAKGTKINATIGQAFEDDGMPMVLDVFAHKLLLPRKSLLYASSYGQQQLRELWKDAIITKNPTLNNMSLPIVTNGLTHGLSIVSELFVNKNDSLVIPDKMWGNYKLIFSQARFNTFPLFKDGFNVEGLRNALVSQGKHVVLLNFPNNPGGYTPTEEEATQIVHVLRESAERGNTLIVICDDAYFGLVYEDGVYTHSIFSLLAEAHENILAIKVDGITKEAYVWGLRVGFLTYGYKGMASEAAKVLEDKTAAVVRGRISNICNHSQLLAIEALQSDSFIVQQIEKSNILKKRYEKVKETLALNLQYREYFTALPFNSGYFMCVKLHNHNAHEIREKLLKNHNIGVIALGDDLLRIAYSSISVENIPVVFDAIYEECKKN